MRRAGWSWVLFGLLAAVPALSDTVTKSDHLSVNGKLTQMSGGVITLVAQFKSGPQTLQIGIADVETIEFNDTTFNPGAPPKALGLTPPPAAPTRQAGVAGQLILRGGKPATCKLLSIDAQMVHCEGKDGDHPRRVTLRILVGEP